MEDMGWTIHVAAAAPFAADDPVDEQDLDGLIDVLEGHGAAVAGGPGRYEATFSLSAADLNDPSSFGDATEVGVQKFLEAVNKVGLPEWPIVRLEVQTWAEQDAELAQPVMPALAGVAEAAVILRVARQRIAELERTHEHFPRPLAELAATKVWDAAALRAYDEAWERRPGRPGATVANRSAASGQSLTKAATGKRSPVKGSRMTKGSPAKDPSERS